MSKAKKVFMVIAAVLIAVGFLMLVAAFFMSGGKIEALGTVEYKTEEIEVTEAFENIYVSDSDSCNVELALSKDDVCRVCYTADEDIEHKIDVSDNTLNIISVDNRKWYDNIEIFVWEETGIIIYLPEKDYKNLEIYTTAGNIEVDENFTFEKVVAESTSGDVGISDINVMELNAESTSGDVEMSDIKSNELIASSTSGDIELESVYVSGNAKITTVSGDIDFEDFDAEAVNMESTSGDIKGSMKSAKNYYPSTVSGDITVPVSDSVAGDCVVKTISGDIKIGVK